MFSHWGDSSSAVTALLINNNNLSSILLQEKKLESAVHLQNQVNDFMMEKLSFTLIKCKKYRSRKEYYV